MALILGPSKFKKALASQKGLNQVLGPLKGNPIVKNTPIEGF